LASGVFTHSHQSAQALRENNFVTESVHFENSVTKT
jgi:hypothetical protein